MDFMATISALIKVFPPKPYSGEDWLTMGDFI